MSEERTVRIDKWLWSIRAYKTRSLAADACKGNKITVGGMSVKPSREVKEGDIVTIKKPPVIYTFRVLAPWGHVCVQKTYTFTPRISLPRRSCSN